VNGKRGDIKERCRDACLNTDVPVSICFVLNSSEFALISMRFILNSSEFALISMRFVLNSSEFVLISMCFVLNSTEFVLISIYFLLNSYCMVPDYKKTLIIHNLWRSLYSNYEKAIFYYNSPPSGSKLSFCRG